MLRTCCKTCIISSLQAKGDLPIDQFHSRQEVKQGMAQVIVRENEGLENALKRFKRACARDGVMAEVRKREHYEKPSVKRKKKSEAARKKARKY